MNDQARADALEALHFLKDNDLKAEDEHDDNCQTCDAIRTIEAYLRTPAEQEDLTLQICFDKVVKERDQLRAQVEDEKRRVTFLAGRVQNAHTLLQNDEDHKAMVLLAETWLEHRRSHTSTVGGSDAPEK